MSHAAHRTTPLLLSALLLISISLLATAHAARAQFSGPALTAPTTDPATLLPTPAAELLHLDHSDIHLEPGDLVAVHIFGSADYAPTVRVNLDSSMQLPLIGSLSVKDLTLDQSENLVAERLKSGGMYRDPQVTLQVMESATQIVTVTGEAHAVLPVSGVRHLLEILAAAGGLPPNASHTITIDRPGVPQPIVVALATDPLRSADSNVAVYPGDTIVVSRVGVVYLLGEFKNPGAIPIQQNSPLTLLEATSLGGGALFNGHLSDLRIIRTVNRQRTLVPVDIKKVMQGKAPDPVLQADDILYLPTSPAKAAISSGGIGVLFNLVSIILIATQY
ncbi:MAG TPA: polysaccharide biosynthesis/export family protein [Granulicella sp.]|jgi:polysaccharide export outer membrane protein|nr:polysaccharide biosynthesis/export family protein [Granulicella sp.]